MESLERIRSEIISFIKYICKEKGYNIMALMITDIMNGGSEILYAGDAVVVMKDLFNSVSEETTGFLPGIISRKKQVVPQILNKLSYY
jgi:manganese-dependent inorganic pyrophosphatase